MTSTSRARILLAFALLVLALGFVFFKARTREYDPDFDTGVASPAYTGPGPVVLFDEGHRNAHTVAAAYRPFAELARNDGYDLRVVRAPFTQDLLRGASVLVVVLARGRNDAEDADAFSSDEVATVARWVREGGALLLVTDHWPFGAAAASLAAPFGIEMGKGLVEDAQHHDAERGASHLVFSEENGLLGDHPIVHGARSEQRVRRVLTFTGQSVAGPPDAVAFLKLSAAATERPPSQASVQKDGGNTRVSMEYGEPVPAAGRAQGLALAAERGRVVVLGEAGMLRAERRERVSVGMNVAGYDNRQLALNILHWLSRAL